MRKIAVRNFRGTGRTPARVFDVIVEDGKVDLEVKIDKMKFEKIPWEDVVCQVEAARRMDLSR